MLKKVLLAATGATLVVAFVVSASAYVCASRSLRDLREKVRLFEEKHGGDVAANLSRWELDRKVRLELEAAEKKRKADAESATVKMPEIVDPCLHVTRASYNGDDNEVELQFSERPSMDDIRSYVKVHPMNSGTASFRYSGNGDVPRVIITGDFPFSTNVTVAVQKGLPTYKSPAGEVGALTNAFAFAFKRLDVEPNVRFANDGRYLPPNGSRALAIESVNVTNIFTSICRVEPRNLVEMLKKENSDFYYDKDGLDSENMEEFSREAVTNLIRCVNRPNRPERNLFPITLNDGLSTNGIFLAEVLIDDHGRADYRHWWNSERTVYNPLRSRLVVISDLGLRIRAADEEKMMFSIWVTSLTKGVPVPGAKIEVYARNNVLIMRGETDSDGWCMPERIDDGEAFAVIVTSADGSDMTFMSLATGKNRLDETNPDGARDDFLKSKDLEAFVWTERGIYRHNEKIFIQALLRTGERTAPQSLPICLELLSPSDAVRARQTIKTDETGSIICEAFSVGDDQASGEWTIQARLPGKDGKVLGSTKIKVEEFAPPQIRVNASILEGGLTNLEFAVRAEHLFGGPAHGLMSEGAVVFEDVPFAPVDWKGWVFGDNDRGLKPSFRRLAASRLDHEGRVVFKAPIWASSGLPKAAVRVTVQGTVFEDGGRPATTRASETRHYYPYYIGSTLTGRVGLKADGGVETSVACVLPDGNRYPLTRNLRARVESVESVYSYKKNAEGWQTWTCDYVRTPIAEDIACTVPALGEAKLTLPITKSGDYVVKIYDPETNASFGRNIYVCDDDEDIVRAPLANPQEVTITPDKAAYRVGEKPKLLVKSPFPGWAIVDVMRDSLVYSHILQLNATSEVELEPVEANEAPSMDIAISVIRAVKENEESFAVRARGLTTILIRPEENEIPVQVSAALRDLKTVDVDVSATNATYAVVAIVDEGIHSLVDGKTPDPVGFFGSARQGYLTSMDIHQSVLPVYGDDKLKVSGVKTGGGFGAEMLSRVSPVPSRRFKPLALWSAVLPVENGRVKTTLTIPEFVGEIRVTAFAWSEKAAGARSTNLKVVPKIVTQPDAPRFVAPNDAFEVTLPIHNRSGASAEVEAEIRVNDAIASTFRPFTLPTEGSTNLVLTLRAPSQAGELKLSYHVSGAGEKHEKKIDLPVRPAVAWRETSGATPESEWVPPKTGRCKSTVFDSPMGELKLAIDWLADYPHGCLEQTASRVFPLIGAGGILNTVSPKGQKVVEAGVRRVESMVRSRYFVMWPDCDYEPWDNEVSQYAAHFLIEAKRSGIQLNPRAEDAVGELLKRWAMSTNETVSAYACHTLALAGKAEKDRMLRLYDAREKLSLLSRARLARAFAMEQDRARAETLLANATSPSSVKEAAFAMIALLELNPSDARILPLMAYLNAQRDKKKLSWGTTEENAHALLAIGEYYRRHPAKADEKIVVWQTLELPRLEDVKAESNGLNIERRILTAEGGAAKLDDLRCGEMVYLEYHLKTIDTRDLADLVIEDLFPAAFEPILGESYEASPKDWVLRADARDDRLLIYSKHFYLEKDNVATFRIPVRVVSAGEFALPAVRVESMYHPTLNACSDPGRVVVHH